VLAASVDAALNRAIGAGAQFREQSAQIDQVAMASGSHFEAMRQAVGELAQALSGTASDAVRVANEAAQSCRLDAAALIDATRTVNEQAASVREAVQRQMNDLAAMSREVDQLAGSLKQTVTVQAGELDQATAAAKANSAVVREQLAGHAAELAAMAERIGQRLGELGDDLRQKAGTMIGAADQALARAGDVGGTFQKQSGIIANAFNDAIDRAEALVQRVRQQTDVLAKAARAAANQIQEMEQVQNATSRDLFLRFATEVIDELNKLAVDINSLLDDDVPDDVWKAFHKGDRSIFARRLARNKDVYTVPALEKLFATDNRFRDLVVRYMRKFDLLLVQSGKADPEDMLRATFLTADVGKLYLIMTRTLGSVEKLN
jgi:hypothetical protein